MKKLIGLHTGDGWFRFLDVIKKWQPPTILVLSPNKDEIKQLRAACPNSIIIGRIYVDDAWGNDFLKKDPEGFAKWSDQEIRNRNIPEIDYWQVNNEPTPYWDWLPNINTYNLELMKLGDKNGYKVGILSVSVGNFDLPEHDRMVYWRELLECLKYCQKNKHVVLVHQYQKPKLLNHDESDNWLIFRLEKQVLPNLKELGLSNLKFIISEFGVDHLIDNGSVGGFQKSMSDNEFLEQLKQWENFEQEYTKNILGCCIFMLGSQSPWESYSITNNSNVANMIADYYSRENEGSTPPNIDNKIILPVIKNEKPDTSKIEWDERLTKRGIVLKKYDAKEGESYWECIKGEYLEEKEHIFVNTEGIDGSPVINVDVQYYWADGKTDAKSKDITNDPYAFGMSDFAMHAHSNSYGVRITSGPSDDIWGMGLGSVEQPDWNIHVSYRFTFRRQVMAKKTETPKEETKPQETIKNDKTYPFTGKVIAAGLNVRSQPQMGDNIINVLANGAIVTVYGVTSDGWYNIGQNQWVSDQYVAKLTPDDEIVSSLLDNFSRIYKIEREIVQATFNVESGGRPYGPDGRVMIRFENHIFHKALNNDTLYNKYFYHNSDVNSHRWRPDENSEWVVFHGNQKLEWKVFEFARNLSAQAAEESTSYGMGQIMGFNAVKVGYVSAAAMLKEFSSQSYSGVISQVCAFFAYCVNTNGCIQALQNKDFETFALRYNGARSYTDLLEAEYKKVKGS